MLLPISSVEFLQMPASLSSGEYPLLSSRTQSLSGRTKATYSMHVKEDLQQVLKTPEFTGWSDCNMVRFGGDLYWIIQANTSTDSAHSIEFVVSYCGPSSVLHKGNSLAGVFSRLPTERCPWLQRTPISSSLQKVSSWALPQITEQDGEQVFWVQLTCTKTSGEYQQYGMFVIYSEYGQMDHKVKCWKEDDTHYYPTLEQVLYSPGLFGTTASAIVDISISSHCPFAYTVRDNGSYQLNAVFDDGDSGWWIPTTNASASGSDIRYYDLSVKVETQHLVPYTASKTITVSSFQRGCGTLTVRDTNGSSIATIPMAYAPSGSVTVKITGVSDLMGIYTYLDIGGYITAIPEGHLPWTGTSWDEYRSYSLAYDRDAMEQSIDFSNQRVAVGIAQNAANTIQSAAMGAIGGNVAGAAVGAISGAASFAISTWATMRESEISEAEARSTQELAERRMAGQPCTAYNVGYGLTYCMLTYNNPAAIWLEMPAQLTSSIDADYTACFGFPAEGLRSVSIQEGYYKGRLYDTTLARGPKFDRCNEALQNGLLFKEV